MHRHMRAPGAGLGQRCGAHPAALRAGAGRANGHAPARSRGQIAAASAPLGSPASSRAAGHRLAPLAPLTACSFPCAGQPRGLQPLTPTRSTRLALAAALAGAWHPPGDQQAHCRETPGPTPRRPFGPVVVPAGQKATQLPSRTAAAVARPTWRWLRSGQDRVRKEERDGGWDSLGFGDKAARQTKVGTKEAGTRTPGRCMGARAVPPARMCCAQGESGWGVRGRRAAGPHEPRRHVRAEMGVTPPGRSFQGQPTATVSLRLVNARSPIATHQAGLRCPAGLA